MKDSTHPYVGRGGLKIEHALRDFHLDVTGLMCADFGCNVGGFTDCLLRHGAAHVIAVDTGYGALDYRLRTDERVTVMERTNALHADPPEDAVIDLIVADMGWTPQRLVIPAALRWLAPDSRSGRIVTLIKPHYELTDRTPDRSRRRGGVILSESEAAEVVERVVGEIPSSGARVIATTQSPIQGGAARGKRGNVEYLALLERY